jgi:uncharacterized membrane protein YhdT
MHPNPQQLDKYRYIHQTPTWKVRTLYLFGIMSWLFVVYGFSGMFLIDPFFQWFVAPIILLITLYHLLSFGINLFYRQFSLEKHLHHLKDYWSHTSPPSIDILVVLHR